MPIDAGGIDAIAGYEDGTRAIVSLHIPRNERQFRLWQALVTKIVESGAWDGGRSTFEDWLKLQGGYVKTVIDGESGKTFYVPGSLKIEAMDDIEFRSFFDATLQAVCEKLLNRRDYAWLRREIEQAVDKRNYFGRTG